MENSEFSPIVARELPEAERMSFLPRHFGVYALMAEGMVYSWMRKLCADYRGARWKFYELSNGGFYMAPDYDGPMHLSWPENWFEGDMSTDAAGIVATIYAINNFLWNTPSSAMEGAYHALRDFAIEHSEANLILAAID